MISWHRYLLFITFLYFSLLFNPHRDYATVNANGTTFCPDKYAVQLPGGNYLRCENFDLYYEELFKGVKRVDLYLENELPLHFVNGVWIPLKNATSAYKGETGGAFVVKGLGVDSSK